MTTALSPALQIGALAVDLPVVLAPMAGVTDLPGGTIVNAAGGDSMELLDVVNLVGEVAGSPVKLDWREVQPGDVRRTGGSIERARELLGWTPTFDLRTGIERQVAWHRDRRISR